MVTSSRAFNRARLCVCDFYKWGEGGGGGLQGATISHLRRARRGPDIHHPLCFASEDDTSQIGSSSPATPLRTDEERRRTVLGRCAKSGARTAARGGTRSRAERVSEVRQRPLCGALRFLCGKLSRRAGECRSSTRPTASHSLRYGNGETTRRRRRRALIHGDSRLAGGGRAARDGGRRSISPPRVQP